VELLQELLLILEQVFQNYCPNLSCVFTFIMILCRLEDFLLDIQY
jgi:hypothetical protein